MTYGKLFSGYQRKNGRQVNNSAEKWLTLVFCPHTAQGYHIRNLKRESSMLI